MAVRGFLGLVFVGQVAFKYLAEFAILARVIQMDLLRFRRNGYGTILRDLNL